MRGLAVYGGLLLLTVALFLIFPGLDLATSRLFYDPQHGFFLADWPPVRVLTEAIPRIAWGIAILVLLASAWLFLMRRPLWRLDRKALLFLFLSTSIGPGLITNTVLKDHWGRARPHQIEAFGGTKQFTAAPLPAAQCATNCSFVSGHAALGFSLVAFAFLLPSGRRRRGAEAAALGFGGLVGLARIAAGGHFLSDVVYAGLLVYGTSWLLHVWVVERDALATPAAKRCYRAGGHAAMAAWRGAMELYEIPAGRMALWAAAVAIAEITSMSWIDEPVARLFHPQDPSLNALFRSITWFGLGYPYLVLFGLSYGVLRWGGATPRLRPYSERMRSAAEVPLFLFLSVALSGIAVDVLKVIFGRTRPKLLFAQGVDRFTWLAGHADHWSFPSGHTTTIAAVMTALWCLWPRHVLFYIALGLLVAASRVALDQHYVSDVLMGAAIGALTARLVWLYLYRRPARGGWRYWRRDAPPAV